MMGGAVWGTCLEAGVGGHRLGSEQETFSGQADKGRADPEENPREDEAETGGCSTRSCKTQEGAFPGASGAEHSPAAP